MANSTLQPAWLKQSQKGMRRVSRTAQNLWRIIIQPQPVSKDYQRWRDRLLWKRFWLSTGIAITWMVIAGIASFYEMFVNPEQLLLNLGQRNLTHLFEPLRLLFFLHKGVILGLLGLLILFRKSQWGRKYPSLIVVLFPWAVSFIPGTVLRSCFGIPGYPEIIMFMAQVAILPVYWRLHFIAQAVPIAYYFCINPLLGLSTFGGTSIYRFSYVVELVLVCMVCEVGVYLYEQSKQSELDANRRLQLCVHAITHDLRTPVMGSSMLLESIRQSTPADQPIQLARSEMSHLIQGCDRILELMNTLLDNQTLSQSELVLNRQPIDLSAIVSTVVSDFQPISLKKAVQIDNRIASDLPIISADADQIWRVLCNLISNAINHNPPGLNIKLDAIVVSRKRQTGCRLLTAEKHQTQAIHQGSQLVLKVMVQDDGVGISPTQQETLFEPYTRQQATQYQPGLGLGLYICRQIVLAHGGEIGLDYPSQGTIVWFTLPQA